MSSAAGARLEIGRVTRPHGIAGAVKLALHWAGSDALAEGLSVRLLLAEGAERELTIEWLRTAGKQPIVKFAGVSTCDAAEALRGARIEVERSALPPLGVGEYYLVDLIGARVSGPDGPLGEVVEVQSYPTVNVVVVHGPDGKIYEQPLGPPWVRLVDVERKLIELESLDGLIL